MSTHPPVDLDALLLSPAELEAEHLEAVARSLFETAAVAPAKNAMVTTHDGLPVRIYPGAFDHAFFTSRKRADWGHKKEVLDLERVSRVRWIVPVVSGGAAPSECWAVTSFGPHGHRTRSQRLYVVQLASRPYVVWLKEQVQGGFLFESAYPTVYERVSAYTTRQRRLWSRRE